MSEIFCSSQKNDLIVEFSFLFFFCVFLSSFPFFSLSSLSFFSSSCEGQEKKMSNFRIKCNVDTLPVRYLLAAGVLASIYLFVLLIVGLAGESFFSFFLSFFFFYFSDLTHQKKKNQRSKFAYKVEDLFF